MDWEDVPQAVDDWAVKAAAPGLDLRRAVAMAYTSNPVGVYYHPDDGRVGLFAEPADETDLARVKVACAKLGTDPLFLSYQDLVDPDGRFVKVAYSPVVRRTGEILNFFPGQFAGGVPNAPSPLAAMLTSGLLGAGLGYGGGKLLSALLPDRVGKNLGRTGAALGAVLGASPGLAWGGTNLLTGRQFNDPELLNAPAGAPPDNFPEPELGQMFKTSVDHYFTKNADAFARPYVPPEPSAMDVNINALGQTLWDTGAPPALAATTMSSLYAAQQLPDPRSRPGWATAHQLGQLAQNAAGDYAKGLLVGAALNGVIGTPFSATSYGLGNVALGVIGAVVPKLFGG